ncbi:hypothetical protein [Bifidobacterium vansinderenii]|uniref:Uncharacterized protein n=1 Tax=Bifidobacterium vansinderenii TaxID=1984871 RepID=A0A229VXN4_9BIFI|nr:hypothetical protein [Bifidobacterium vansinderenii]OXN00375.1 hypothetical protein Tam10B_1245 [Bifidobacterium vansinderenii]
MAGGRRGSVGVWKGQRVEYIPLDDLVLWTENPRDPLEGAYTNDDVIRRAIDKRNEGQWQLHKLAKEMGDKFDLSELPTVCKIDDGPMYRVYDGNRRVILAMLRKRGFSVDGQRQLIPPDFPDPMPCNVCDKRTALENVERKHKGKGSWKQYERDCFMFRYMGGPKTVLMKLEDLIGAVTEWPILNTGFVEKDVFNKKHLEEMGLLPDEPDFGVPSELLRELVEAIAGKLDNELNTRNARNNPASALPKDLIKRLKESQRRHSANKKTDTQEKAHADARSHSMPEPVAESEEQDGADLFDLPKVPVQDSTLKENRKARTRQVSSSPVAVFGGPLHLKSGNVNNMYRTLEELWNMYRNEDIQNREAFVPIFRMGLRLLTETAASEHWEHGGLKSYVDAYAERGKTNLRKRKEGQDLLTFVSNHQVSPDNLLRLLQSGAHAYASTRAEGQTLAMSVLVGEMLTLSHGRS